MKWDFSMEALPLAVTENERHREPARSLVWRSPNFTEILG